MYKFCVFDMDGTVVNSIVDIAAAMNRSLEKLGYDTYEEDAYYKMVGNGMRVLCERAIPGADEKAVDELVAVYNEDYLKNICVKSYIYDGLTELLHTLNDKGVKCAILSNKPHSQALEVAESLFDDRMFAQVLGQKPEIPIKPSPDGLLMMMKEYGFEKDEVAYIGDTNVDITLGKSAGVFTIGVSWGFREVKELTDAGADAIANNAEELANLLGI